MRAHTIIRSLSVSSNGSTWVKQRELSAHGPVVCAFSILERIDVGETWLMPCPPAAACTFSILERIDVGETAVVTAGGAAIKPFSILERIDVGETLRLVSGLVWYAVFQYPRTDRRG